MENRKSGTGIIASTTETKSANRSYSRRAFVKRVAVAGAAASVVPASRADQLISQNNSGPLSNFPTQRQMQAYAVRVRAATAEYQQGTPAHPDNGDEALYPKKIASYCKGLPHNNLGEVNLNAYGLYRQAIATGDPAAFERIPLGTTDPSRFKLVNPQAGLAFDLEGVDSHATFLPPAPAFGSDQENAEIVELYWMALTRDVPFEQYDTNSLTQQAATDLTRLGNAFKGPKENGQVTTHTLFRDNLPGCLVGPYNSQFRYLPVPFGGDFVDQQMLTLLPNQDFMTDYTEWLNIQNGSYPSATAQFDPVRRFIRTGRDTAQWVHVDVLHQAYFMAMLTLLNPLGEDSEGPIYAPFNPGNPYLQSQNQTGFATFGGPHIATLMPEVATRALKAQWFQKWFVHRRLRPEEYAGRVHNTLTGAANYPIGKAALLLSPALTGIQSRFGSYLLPQVYPEGCPLHPSYGSGHATVAGACVTILKAFFDETFVFPEPVQPSPDGLTLVPYTGAAAGQMTVGGELNKLASNIAQSRNIAGVHWRTDAIEAMRLGEAVAISLLRDQRNLYNENFNGFTFTQFDGSKITI